MARIEQQDSGEMMEPPMLGMLSMTAIRRSSTIRRWLVVAMLASLYLALLGQLSETLDRAVMVAHFGFFLLWQPYFSADRRINPLTLTTLFGAAAAILFAASGWLAILWVAILIGIIGGKVLTARTPGDGRIHLVALAFLLCLLLLWVVPKLVAPAAIIPGIEGVVFYGLPLLLVAIAAYPAQLDSSDSERGTDLFYSVLSFQLAVLLVLGSLALMTYTGRQYYSALLFNILAVSAALFLLGMLWNPYGGFSGLRTYLSRYLLSVGLPFEGWLQELATAAEREHEPANFISHAVTRLLALPWVTGGRWNSADGSGEFGAAAPNVEKFESQDLEISLYTRIALSPAITLHTRLLIRLLGEFYVAKRRERQLKENAYMQAVHETGARLTHDIKNLLQSLYSLSAAGQLLGPEESESYLRMVQRQLPVLSKRLQSTLDRLHAPADAGGTGGAQFVPIADWWQTLQSQYEGRGIDFEGCADDCDTIVPAGLFDSVAENLLENARRKKLTEHDIAIHVTLDTQPRLCLSVSDSGSAVPATIADRLFDQRVSGAAGMGIGLYQAARQAAQAGYRLALANNRPGLVRFTLTPAADGLDHPAGTEAAADTRA
jgi:signal transduction histidine kinase